MPFKETRLGDGVVDDAVAIIVPAWSSIMTSCSLKTYFDIKQQAITWTNILTKIHAATWRRQARMS